MTTAFSLPSHSTVVGKVERAKGRVSIIKQGSFRGVDYRKVKGKIEVGDVVRTKRKSSADISFIDRTRVFLKESSRLIVEKYIPGKEVTINSPMGKVVYRVVKSTRGAYRIKTPTALIGVKGTELATIVDSGISVVIVRKGSVEVVNPELPRYRVVVEKSMATVVRPGMPPSKPLVVSKSVIDKVFSLKETIKEREKPKGETKVPKHLVKPLTVKEILPEVTTTEETTPTPLEKSYPEVITQEKVQETVQEESISKPVIEELTTEITEEESEETVTEAATELNLENGEVKVNVSIPPTETPR